MTPAEFVDKAVGIRWKKDAAGWDGCNCYGLIMLWYRHVHGLVLATPLETEIVAGFHAAQGWHECAPELGATCWMAWRDGAPNHCGVMLSPTEVLHAEGSQVHPGSVRVSSLRAVRFCYGEIRFYRYTPC